MKNLCSLILFVLMTMSCNPSKNGLAPSKANKSSFDPVTYLRNGHDVPEIMIMGTFHFGYPGLDSHVTEDDYRIDVLSKKRQDEVKKLVDYVAQYKPTKIMVEVNGKEDRLMKQYRAWKAGTYDLRANEIDQIGMRLIDKFDLDTLYGIDANSMIKDLYLSKDSTAIEPITERIWAEQDETLYENKFEDRYWDWFDLDDKRKYNMNLLDYFMEMNSPEYAKYYHGIYIMSDDTDNFNGVDNLAINWYSRNLRMMKKIQMVETTPEDRILVLVGAGHSSILKQQFESTPEYELVEFCSL